MRAFHNDHATQRKYLDRVAAHRDADRIVQGETWELDEDDEYRGCLIGCTLESYDHKQYELELGVPEPIARLLDRVFEGMPASKAVDFPLDFLRAVPLGADLSGVMPRILHWMIVDPSHGVRQYTLEGSEQRAAVERVASLYADGTMPDAADAAAWAARAARAADAARARARAAASAAAASAWAAAWAASDSCADAARARARAAASAAAASAWADAWAASASCADAARAAGAARHGYYTALAAKIIELVRCAS